MEYLPYKIEEGSYRIEIFLNKFHGLLTFSSLEEGKEYLQTQLIERIKWEESGKNAQNCIYSADQVSQSLYDLKEGLFGEDLEDGYILKKKETGYFGSMYVNVVGYYILSPFSRPVKKPAISRQEQEKSNNGPGFSNVIAELRTKFENKQQEGILKTTGIMEMLMNPQEEEMLCEDMEEMYLEPHNYDNLDAERFFDTPLPELPPSFPIVCSPIQIRNFDTIQNIITKANEENSQEQEEEKVNKDFSSESEESESEEREEREESESEEREEREESESEEREEREESESEEREEREEREESESEEREESESEEREEREESESEEREEREESESEEREEREESESEESEEREELPKEKRINLDELIKEIEGEINQIGKKCKRIEFEEIFVDFQLEQIRERKRIIKEQEEQLYEESESTMYDTSSEEEESSSEEEESSSEEEESSSEEEESSTEEEESSTEEEESSTEESFHSDDSDRAFWFESSSDSEYRFKSYSL